MSRHRLPLAEPVEGELIVPQEAYFILMEDRHGRHVEIPVTHEPIVHEGSFPGRVRVAGLEVMIKGLTHRGSDGRYRTLLLDNGHATLVSKP